MEFRQPMECLQMANLPLAELDKESLEDFPGEIPKLNQMQ